MATKQMVTAKELMEILSYDQETGEFHWLVNCRRARAGCLAGSIHVGRAGRRYRYIRIKNRYYKAHRLAWLYVHGKWPRDQIDHIDGHGLNNRISNLREATCAQNLHNQGAHRDSVSGFKGISWCRRDRKWQARIMTNGKRKHLGYYDTPEAAYAAYSDAAKQLHKDFARV